LGRKNNRHAALSLKILLIGFDDQMFASSHKKSKNFRSFRELFFNSQSFRKLHFSKQKLSAAEK